MKRLLIFDCKYSQLHGLSEEEKKRQNTEKPVQPLIFLDLWLLPCGSVDLFNVLDDSGILVLGILCF